MTLNYSFKKKIECLNSAHSFDKSFINSFKDI